jgi:hypothetical protein
VSRAHPGPLRAIDLARRRAVSTACLRPACRSFDHLHAHDRYSDTLHFGCAFCLGHARSTVRRAGTLLGPLVGLLGSVARRWLRSACRRRPCSCRRHYCSCSRFSALLLKRALASDLAAPAAAAGRRAGREEREIPRAAALIIAPAAVDQAEPLLDPARRGLDVALREPAVLLREGLAQPRRRPLVVPGLLLVADRQQVEARVERGLRAGGGEPELAAKPGPSPRGGPVTTRWYSSGRAQ